MLDYSRYKKGSTTEVITDEASNPLHIAGAEAELKLLEFVRKYMTSFDALLFAGSRPHNWSANICARICEVAHKAGKLILADFRGDDLLGTLKVCTPDIIKVNEAEFCQTFECKGKSEKDLLKAIEKKSAELNNIVIVTRGAKDTLAAAKGNTYKIPTEKVKAINTTACGDAFDAGFLFDYLQNNNVESAIKAGNHCGALNATTIIPGSIKQPE